LIASLVPSQSIDAIELGGLLTGTKVLAFIRSFVDILPKRIKATLIGSGD